MRFILKSLGVLLLCATAIAQVGTQAVIVGTVTDSSGAIIPAATITVVQAATQLTRTVTSNGSGDFEIPALPIGEYSVSVSAPGMKTWQTSQLNLTIGARTKISPKLLVGSVDQVITVSTNAALQTENTSVTTVLNVPVLLELPNATRNPISLVELVPGMRYDGAGGPEGGAQVHGMGTRTGTTSFSLDGINTNAPMDVGAIGVPIMDDIAEMSVDTANASADAGRDPIQVKLVTKSGSNQFHGSAWEYFQNEALNAVYSFASKTQPKPRVRFNQFGGNLGGPIFSNRMFFYGSFQATLVPSAQVYNQFAPLATNYEGNFPKGVVIKDPLTGKPFPNGPAGGSSIPADRINPASKFFIPFLLVGQPGGAFGSLYQAQAPALTKTYQSTLRLDYYINRKQRIYVRNIALQARTANHGYRTDVPTNNSLDQDTLGVNYTYTITPNVLLTATAGFIQTANWFSTPDVGHTNYSQEAGIQGIATAGREASIGIPDIVIAGGYPGTSLPFGVNGKLWGNAPNTNLTLTVTKHGHTINAGYELQDNRVFLRHASSFGRGNFNFNGQYTGNGLADFLLGYAATGTQNLPLDSAGLDRSLLHGIHADDTWKIRQNLTVNFGLRYEYWAAPHFVAGNAATWDTAINKIVVGADDNGKVNLTHQPAAAFIGAATQGLWVPASDVGIHHIIPATGQIEPRVGFSWQPTKQNDIVLRGAYGVYAYSITGNHAAAGIGSIPFFSLQQISAGTTPVDWRYLFPADPSHFVQPSVAFTASLHLKTARIQQWNASIETAMPLASTLTVGYIGTKSTGQPYAHSYNDPPPSAVGYPNLSAAHLYPAYGSINVTENGVDTWYHGLQVQWERRNRNGLYYQLSYMFSKSMSNHAVQTAEGSQIVPYAPAWYERGLSTNNNRHNLKVSSVYQLPLGRSRHFFPNMNRAVDAVVGGWELGGYYAFLSGDPLVFGQPGATLGNGWGTRPNLTGIPPTVSNPSKTGWFNPAAFSTTPNGQFGNSGIGAVTGPALNVVNLSLLKAFSWREGKYFQIRADAFNALNHVNLKNPTTTIGSTSTGQIFGAQAARTVQLGAKVVF